MTKRACLALVAFFALIGAGQAQYVTLTGTLQSSNGLPASNYVISFTPSQFGFIAGSGVVVNTATTCATSTDGSVVYLPNPLIKPVVTVGFTGTLAPANYYVKYAFYDSLGHVTLVSPETVIQLNSTGQLVVASPASGMPQGSMGMNVYIATSSGAETLQGQSTGSAAFIQSVPLTTGAAVPTTNNTVCKEVANDAIWPVGTGYTVALTDTAGNTLPGYPMQWQLMGPGNTINLSNGLPYYNGVVVFPSPILASPLNNALQSIAGPLSLTGYDLLNVGAIGVGTSLPAWSIDVENGEINASGGYLLGGNGGTAGQCIISDGTFLDTLSTCLTTTGAFSAYQTVDEAGTPLTKRTVLNFDGTVVATDSSSPARTNVGLPNKGTAGTYPAPTSITTDAQGRITSITSGGSTTPVNRTCGSNSSGTYCYKVDADGWITESGVTVAFGSGSPISLTLTFPLAWSNAAISAGNVVVIPSLTAFCTTGSDSGTTVNAVKSSLTTTSVTLTAEVDTGTCGSGTYAAYWTATGW